MTRSRTLYRIVLLSIVGLLVGLPPKVVALSFWDDLPNDVLRERLLEEMTPEELIGQTLMLGWLGEDPSPEIVEWIRNPSIGGVKVFGWNGGNLVRLARAIGTMQEIAGGHRLGIPLITATDQEGGWVRHVKGGGDLVTRVTPGNMAIGASALPYDAYRSGYYIGMELRALGINMNFAPTVDVYVNPAAHVIGPRAFSSDPVQSGVLGVAFYHGHEEARVIATAKHFPGHGNASEDSHGVMPIIGDDLSILTSRDLVPFRFLINEGVPAVLSGHLSFPNVAPDRRPASLSRYFKEELLRDELGFDGLIITDDLYMAGAWEYGADQGWGIEEIVIEALRVGNDMVMLSRTPEPGGSLWRRLIATWENDSEFRRRIRESAGRIIDLKLAYLKPADRVPLAPSTELIDDAVAGASGNAFFRDQAARSVTMVRTARLPLSPDDAGRVMLAGKDNDFMTVGREFFPGADRYRFETGKFFVSDPAERSAFLRAARSYDTIVLCLSDPHTMELAAAVEELGPRVIVFSILTPIYLRELPWVESAVAVYGWGEESFRAGFSALTGRIEPQGAMPILLDVEPR